MIRLEALHNDVFDEQRARERRFVSACQELEIGDRRTFSSSAIELLGHVTANQLAENNGCTLHLNRDHEYTLYKPTH